MKKLFGLTTMILVIMIIFAGTACAAGKKQPTFTVNIAFYGSESHPTFKAINNIFAKKLRAESKGRLNVIVDAKAKTGTFKEFYETYLSCQHQIYVAAPSYLGGVDRRIQILDMPYLFASRASAFEAVDGVLGQKLAEWMGERGIIVLGYMENGFRNVANNTRPVKSPTDLKGLKIQALESPMNTAFLKAMGAQPTAVSMSNIYTNVEKAAIDGVECSYSVLVDTRLNAVTRFTTETNHMFSFDLFFANKYFMDKLPEDLRELVINVAKETTSAQRNAMEEETKNYIKAAADSGMIIYTPTSAEKKKFTEAAENIYKSHTDIFGKELMDIVKAVHK